MFGNIDKIEEMKARLNSVSPSFCLAKWTHATVHLMTGRTHSCYLPPTHKIPLEEIARDPSALHNTSCKKRTRQMMKEGQRPDECSICWRVEDLPGNHYSDRHYRGVDDWTMPFFEKIRDAQWDANINPVYLEVSFSSTCNFKCAYCSPAVSTEWMREIRAHGPYQLATAKHQDIEWMKKQGELPLSEEDNPYVEAFWKWWPDLVRDLLYFRITGGEPLLSPNTFKILEMMDSQPAPNLNFSINSNLGIPERNFQRFLTLLKPLLESGKIRSHMLHTSLDTFGPQAEYIRNGLVLSEFVKNLKIYLRELPSTSMAFMSTFNNLSVVGYRKFLEFVLELRTEFGDRRVLLDIPHLQGPEHHNIQILTPDYREYLRADIDFMKQNLCPGGFREAEIFKMSRILEWMSEDKSEDWLRLHRANFYLFYREHDRRRGTSFQTTFPEMQEFERVCRRAAVSYVGESHLSG